MLRVSTMKKVNTIHEVPETSKGKGKKVKRNLDVHLDEESGSGAECNDASEQDNDSGSGISSVKKKKAKPLNVNYRVEQFGLLMEGIEGEKMEVVEGMGFGHLKHLSGQAINKELGYWLMTRVNADTGELMAGDGREFTLSSEQVQCMLGIPNGERPVPLQMDDTNKVNIDKICRWFSKVKYGKASISIVDAKEYVLGEEVDSEKYRVAFLVVLLGMFLCPTTNFSSLASELTPALCAAEEASQYDWCSFVLDFLLRRARAFSHSFDNDGYAVGCGGCTYFLAIFYLDRLRQPPVRWGEYPRVKVFDKDLLKNVAEADRRNSGDFGKTKSVDVAYGEVHPRAARDIYPMESLTFAEEVANRIGEVIRTEVGVVVDVVSRVIGEQNVRREDGRLCISADRRTTTDDAAQNHPSLYKVRRSSCYGVLSPVGYVDSQYVAATTALNTQNIDCVIAFDNYVLPPPQHLILTKRTQEKQKFITKFAEKIDCDVHDVDKIFLPVVIQEHWICLLFAVKEQMIWVLDSLFPDPVSQHQDAINKFVM
ncbi:Protein MAINTENANCE OF MERISTEMS [Bienertia sinuspersici]